MEDNRSGLERIKRQEVIEAAGQRTVLDYQFVGKLPKANVTPSVLNVTNWDCVNTGAVTITDFKDGQNGQPLILRGDGFTTIANNANIKTSTGANKLLAVDRLYYFQLRGGIWYEMA